MMELHSQFKSSSSVTDALLVVRQSLDAMLKQINSLYEIKYDKEITQLEKLLDANDDLLAQASLQMQRTLLEEIDKI
jgi:hypothetical protein